MRRTLLVGLFGGLLVAIALLFFVLLVPKPAHISVLVPRDFAFGVFSSSLNDLDELYEAPYRNREADPAKLRYGRPVNVPGLNGFSYDDPVGSFLTAEGQEEIFLVPVRDADAFEEAFEAEREQITMRPPTQPAKNYLALSEERATVKRGTRNDLVLKASRYPLAVAGHPRDGLRLRLMLTYLLLRESPRKPPGVPFLARVVSRIPDPVAEAIARECDDLLVGFPLPAAPAASAAPGAPGAVRVEGEAGLNPLGMVARSAHLSAELDLTNMVASFPYDTVLLLGGVLDARGWRDLGLPLPVGDAAVAFGIVEKKMHARRFTFLMAARPSRPSDLQELATNGPRLLLDDPATEAKLAWNRIEDGDAVVSTARLGAPPAWLARPLRSDADAAPPVFLSTTVERGIWYCAIGSQAESAVRHALACLRDKPELGLRRLKPVGDHSEFLARPHVGVALVTAGGLKAFEYRMPLFEVASLGQPPSLTAILDIDDRAKLDLRIAR